METLEKKVSKEELSEETLEDKKEELSEETLEDKKKEISVENNTPEENLKDTQDKLLRTLAEMENQRRRYEKEKKEAFEFGGFSFAGESLALVDNIDRAIISFKNDENLKNNKDLNKIIDGIEIVKKDLISIFKKNGIEEIECINRKFDPNFHQAMFEVENSSKDAGTVVQEIQKGYMMKGRLLRPSLVGVAKKTKEKEEKK
jgi:molecular chaperone GrpE|tara:strand:- start:234 stop:839 length:606 start_codon:yes stop_codon:yes gene_type:complete